MLLYFSVFKGVVKHARHADLAEKSVPDLGLPEWLVPWMSPSVVTDQPVLSHNIAPIILVFGWTLPVSNLGKAVLR